MRLSSFSQAASTVHLPVAIFFIALVCPAFAGAAQNVPPLSPAARDHIQQVLRSLPRGVAIDQVAVSPNGKRLAWIMNGEIRVAPLDNLTAAQRVTAAPPGQNCDESDMTWAPDSSALAFFADCAQSNRQDDLYLSSLDGQPARRLTALKGYVQDPAFSPNGKFIAFLYVPGSMRPAGALAAQDADTGVIGATPTEVQRIAVVWTGAPATASPSLISPEYLHAYEFDWSPDSTSLAFIAADPPGENNWWTARLFSEQMVASVEYLGATVVRRVNGLAPRVLVDPATVSGPLHGLQIALPRWSPDGKRIAFIGGLMSDQGATGGDVWIISADGGQPRDLTPERRATPSWIAWADDAHIFVDE